MKNNKIAPKIALPKPVPIKALSDKKITQKVQLPIKTVVSASRPIENSRQSKADEDYFVVIKRPQEVRRQLLEASKKSIYCLQNFYRLEMIREKKLRELAKARGSFRELMYLNKMFNNKLPKYLHKEDLTVRVMSDEPSEKRAHKLKTAVRKPIRKEKSDLEKLEDSLRSIEGRLRNID